MLRDMNDGEPYLACFDSDTVQKRASGADDGFTQRENVVAYSLTVSKPNTGVQA